MKFSIHSTTLAKRFTNVFTNLSNLSDSVVLYFKEDGLYIQGMDSSHVSLYEAKFHKDWFSTYKVDENDTQQIAISLEYFKKVLSTRGDNQLIYIEYNGATPDTLTIIFRSMVKDSKEFPREYEMMLMDIDTETVVIPDEEQSVQFYVDTKTFSSLIKQLSMFDESVNIRCSEEEIKFSSKGIDGSMNVNLFDNDKDYVDEFMIDEDYKLNIRFALRYFEHFCAFQKVSHRVRLSFTNDFPVEMFYSLETTKDNKKSKPDCEKEIQNNDEDSEDNEGDEEIEDTEEEDPKSFLRFFLAPKIVDEDENNEDDDEEYEESDNEE